MFLLTEAYPNLIKQLIILDLPWVLKSVWSIVKLWLDEKQKSYVFLLFYWVDILENPFRIIHFVDEKGLEEKVPKSAWTKELKGMRLQTYWSLQLI